MTRYVSLAFLLLRTASCVPGAQSRAHGEAPREPATVGTGAVAERSPVDAPPDAGPSVQEGPVEEPSSESPSADELSRETMMARDLYRDDDFRLNVCGDAPCDERTFRTGPSYRQEVLSEHPPIVGYFVEPKRVGENFFTGIFLLRGNALEAAFTFFGSGIGADRHALPKGGVRNLVGRERTNGWTWTDYVYAWDGKAYREAKRTSEVNH